MAASKKKSLSARKSTAKKSVSRKSSSLRPAARKVVRKAAVAQKRSAPTVRLTGLDAQVFRLAKATLPRRSPLLPVIKQYGVSAQGVLQAATVVESAVRTHAGLPFSTFADTLAIARSSNAISEDAFHMATRLRHIRNGFAHGGHSSHASQALALVALMSGVMAMYYLEARA